MNNNVLEFFVKMKDLMSSGLAKIAQNSKAAFTKVESNITGVINKNKELAKSFEDVERKATSSGNGLSRFFSGLKGLGIGTAIAGIVGGAAIGGIIKDSVGKAIQYQKTTKSFEVLTGNAGGGKELAGQLNTLQQDTILGPEVFKSAQTMIGFGITAEKVIPTLKMLGDISMGDAEKLQSLTLAFSQTQAAGKLTGQELLQYINAGFNPLNQISKDTGKSMGELRKEMEAGKVTSDMVTKAFQSVTGAGGLFNNMLGKMGETTGGKLAQLQGTVESLKIAIGERFRPVVDKATVALTKLAVTVKSWLEIPVARQVDDQVQKIQELQLKLQSLSTTEAERVSLLKELEQINPALVAGINAQSIEYGKLQNNILGVIAALNQKKLADRFQKENADVILDYNEAQKKIVESKDRIIYDIVKAAPGLLNRTDLTFGQQQMEAQRILQEKIKAGNVTRYFKSTPGSAGQTISQDGTVEEDLLNSIKNWVAYNNKAVATANKLQPEYLKVQRDIKTATDAYGKVFGLDKMSAANIAAGSTGSAAAAGKDDKSIASSVTGGGPRIINIHGVKFMDKLELHTATFGEGVDSMQEALENMFLRLLNSGASVQS